MPYLYLLENIFDFSVHYVTDKNQCKNQNSWFRIPLTSLSVQHCGLSVHNRLYHFSKCLQIKPTFSHSMCIGEIRSHAKFQV